MDASLDSCVQQTVRCLLLLYLFVMKAAADCPKPQGRENIVLSNEALLKNKFPEGSDATLQCANGYVKESGSGIITCTDGNWSEPDLTCRKKDCGPPKPQPHMSFNTSGGTLFGDIIRVICDKGYTISGSSFRQCYAHGWNGRGKCEIVTCGKLDGVANGRHTWDSQDFPKYGEIIQYVCDEGHTLVGNDSIMCTETGKYNSQPPECKGVATEDVITTPHPTQGDKDILTASTSTGSPATPTAHSDKTITTSATPSVSPSAQGGRGILSAEDRATTTSVTPTTSSLFQDKHGGAVDNKDDGNAALIGSVIAVGLIVVGIVGVFLYKFLLRRKGSYDTREDLRPELLQFQNL